MGKAIQFYLLLFHYPSSPVRNVHLYTHTHTRTQTLSHTRTHVKYSNDGRLQRTCDFVSSDLHNLIQIQFDADVLVLEKHHNILERGQKLIH